MEPTDASPPPSGGSRSIATRTSRRRSAERQRRGARRVAERCAARRVRRRAANVRERMRVESVWLAYGESWVVRDVSLPVRQGEVLALIGASGSGKTTLLRSLNRLTEVTAGAARSGRITLDGEEIHELEVNELRRRVSMVFQQPNPFPMSIFDNVAYALVEHPQPARRRRTAHAASSSMPWSTRCAAPGSTTRSPTTSTARRCGCPAASSSGCASRARSPPSPEVLLLDEPCSALDPISTATIEELIVGLRESVAVVIVTHNLQQASRVADHVAFMHLGELVEYGTSEQIFERPSSSARATTSAARSDEARCRDAAVKGGARRDASRSALALAAPALALSGCETTAEKSAKLERAAKRVAHGEAEGADDRAPELRRQGAQRARS